MESIQFELVYIHSDSNLWMVRQINPGQNFEIRPNSTLGGVQLALFLSQPRKLDENGQLDLNHFILRPLNKAELHRLKVGQVVELVMGPFEVRD